MKGDAAVIAKLKELLQSEFTAMAQYRVDAQVLRNQGFKNLKHYLHGLFYEENTHSKELLNRMLLIGGVPDPSNFVADPPVVAVDVVDIYQKNLALENDAVSRYNRAVRVAEDADDNVTAKLLRHILKEETAHAEWLEAQLSIIRKVTKENYLVDNVRER